MLRFISLKSMFIGNEIEIVPRAGYNMGPTVHLQNVNKFHFIVFIVS